jgi:hypothetical protein
VIGGYIADVTAMGLFAQGDPGAMAMVDAIDMAAFGLLVPVAALIEAHRGAQSAQEAEYLGHLMGFGVVIPGEMTMTVADAAIEVVSAAPGTALLVAEACAHSRLRGWPVLTAGAPEVYEDACPGVLVRQIAS